MRRGPQDLPRVLRVGLAHRAVRPGTAGVSNPTRRHSHPSRPTAANHVGGLSRVDRVRHGRGRLGAVASKKGHTTF